MLDRIRNLILQGRLQDAQAIVDAASPDEVDTCEILAERVRILGWRGRVSEAAWLRRRLWAEHRDQLPAWTNRITDLGSRGRRIQVEEMLFEGEVPKPGNQEEETRWLSTLIAHRIDLRNFDSAANLLAQHPDPGHSWVQVDRVCLYQARDELEKALECAREGLVQLPDYLVLRLKEAEILHLLQRRSECLESYRTLGVESQSPFALTGLASALRFFDEKEQAREVYEDLLKRFDLPRDYREGTHLILVPLCRELSDDEGVATHIIASGRRGRKFREMWERHPAGERLELPVPFVRQDHMTCAPATISALLAYFGEDVPQDEIADAITYHGTHTWAQRRWCRERSITHRAFVFDRDTARMLLRKGLPFCLSLRGVDSAHLVAVVGFDEVLDTWILRDPSTPDRVELRAEELEKEIRARGGPCALILPQGKSAMGDGIDLPHEAVSDTLIDIKEGVEIENQDLVRKSIRQLSPLPDGNIGYEARRDIAWATGNGDAYLEAMREWYEKCPEDAWVAYSYGIELGNQGNWKEQRDQVEDSARKLLVPQIWMKLARLLIPLPDRASEARTWVLRAQVRYGQRGEPWSVLSDLNRQDPGQWEWALHCLAIAVNLEPTNEGLAWQYHDLLVTLGRREDGLRFLQERCERLGKKSPDSAVTLARVFSNEGRRAEALAVLDTAAEQHDSPWLRENRLQQLLELDRRQEFEKGLAVARGKLLRSAWWRLSIKGAEHFERMQVMKERLEEAIVDLPTDVELREDWLNVLFEIHGKEATLAAVKQLIFDFPDRPLLNRVAFDFLERLGAHKEAEKLLRGMISQSPAEIWLHGMLGRFLYQRGRYDEAFEIVAPLVEKRPASIAFCTDYAGLLKRKGRNKEARAEFHRALDLEMDRPRILPEIIGCCESLEEIRESLDRIAAGIRKQRVGAGLLDVFKESALRAWTLEEFETFLVGLVESQPDVPGPAMALVELKFHSGRFEDAASRIDSLLQAHPSWARLRHLRSEILLKQGKAKEAEKELQKLVKEVCWYGPGWRELGSMFEERGESERAKEVFRRGIEYVPGYGVLHAYMGSLLKEEGDIEQAKVSFRRAMELDDYYDWVWLTWLDDRIEEGNSQEALPVMEGRLRRLPHSASAYETLSRCLSALGEHERSLELGRKALEMEPHLDHTRFRLFDQLLALMRYEEAEELLDRSEELLGEDFRIGYGRCRLQKEKGDHRGALTELSNRLKEHPEAEWGWERWLTWADEYGEHEQIVALGKNPPEALKDNALFHAYVADSADFLGQPETSLRMLRQALKLDSGYSWVRNRLAEQLLDGGQARAAWRLYADIDPALVAEMGGTLLAARSAKAAGKTELAFRILRQGWMAENLNGEMAAWMMAFATTELGKSADKVVASFLRQVPEENCSPHLLANEILLLACAGEDQKMLDKFGHHLPSLPHKTLASLLGNLGVFTARGEIVGLIEERIEAPISEVELWGQIGLLFVREDRFKAAICYLHADYTRPDAQPWMLANLSYALLRLGRIEDMAKVSLHALTLPVDSARIWHQVFLAYDRFETGDMDGCRELALVPVHEVGFPAVNGAILMALADLAGAGSRRERGMILSRQMPRILGRLKTSRKEDGGRGKRDFERRYFYDKAPGITTWLLCRLGIGDFLLRLRYGIQHND